MLSDEKLPAVLAQFECVEWQYDGLKGGVIAWTKEHGNTNDDPSVLVWVLDAKEKVIGAAGTGEYNSAGVFIDWLGKMKEEHGKSGGGGAAGGVIWGEGVVKEGAEGKEPILEGLDLAKKDKKPALVYVYVPEEKRGEKGWQAAGRDCERMEKGAFADPELAKQAARCFAVRLDFTDDLVHRFVTKSAAVSRAPAVFLIDWKKMGAKPQQWSNPKMKGIEVARILKQILPKE